MKKYVFLFITAIILFIARGNVYAKEVPNIIILHAANETKNGFQVYEEGGDTDAFMKVYNKSFMKESINLYELAKQYSNIKDKEFYVAFKKGSGCYGRIGFYLKKNGNLYDKTKSPYVELSSEQLTNDYKRLQSITQLFPREMEHVLYEIYKEKDDIRKYIDIIDNKSHRLEELINDLFEYTMLTSCDIKLEKVTISLNEFITQVVEGTMPICSQSDLNIFLEAPDKEINVTVDPMKMMRVFENLITNAVRYSYKPGNIKVKISEHKNDSIVCVENEGNIIKKEELDKIFDRL